MFRGQVSVEMLIIVSVVFILLLFVLITAMNQDISKSALENSTIERNVCNNLSYLISTVYAGGPKQIVSHFLELDANISGTHIFVGNNTCSFIGKTNSVNLLKGNIVLKDLNGMVELSNA